MAAIDIKAAINELLGVCLFVFLSTGALGAATPLMAGLLFSVLMWSFGAQLNSALSIGYALQGNGDPVQTIVNVVAQLAGGVCGSMLVCALVSEDNSMMIGQNAINPAYSAGQVVLAEIIMTFLFCTAAFNTEAVNKTLALGFAVFVGYSFLGPIDGCGMNPARSFGPSLVASVGDRYSASQEASDMFEDHWVYWLGPIGGAIIAVGYPMLVDKIPAPKAAAAEEPAAEEGAEA